MLPRLAMTRRSTIVLAVFCACLVTVGAEFLSSSSDKSVANLTKHQIEEELQQCSLVQSLTKHKHETIPPTASWTNKLFEVLFPSSSPAINALLGTLYISGPPNFLLALCPPNIDPSSLTIMVAFAVGGLLGDTLFHLLPEIFLGEVAEGEVRFVMIEPNRNLLLGVAIMVGILTFVAMDKALRIATGGEGHNHDHGHSHSTEDNKTSSAMTSGAATTDSANGDLKKRKSGADAALDKPLPSTPTSVQPSPSIKMSAYLNVIADFTHNITDGLAMSSSFYSSPTLGATTTMAVFFHEIPHEVGDFALLIQGGMDKKLAMGMQFVTALGAVLGTVIGIAVQEYGGSSSSDGLVGATTGIWGTSLTWGDMLLPFTAGTFLYVGTVAVIPELLETGPNKGQELKKTGLQFLAMGVGAAIMLAISWS